MNRNRTSARAILLVSAWAILAALGWWLRRPEHAVHSRAGQAEVAPAGEQPAAQADDSELRRQSPAERAKAPEMAAVIQPASPSAVPAVAAPQPAARAEAS